MRVAATRLEWRAEAENVVQQNDAIARCTDAMWLMRCGGDGQGTPRVGGAAATELMPRADDGQWKGAAARAQIGVCCHMAVPSAPMASR